MDGDESTERTATDKEDDDEEEDSEVRQERTGEEEVHAADRVMMTTEAHPDQ